MTYDEIRRECATIIYALVRHGSEVCDRFESKAESTYFCTRCGYSQYIHLAQQITKATK